MSTLKLTIWQSSLRASIASKLAALSIISISDLNKFIFAPIRHYRQRGDSRSRRQRTELSEPLLSRFRVSGWVSRKQAVAEQVQEARNLRGSLAKKEALIMVYLIAELCKKGHAVYNAGGGRAVHEDFEVIDEVSLVCVVAERWRQS
jgi:hypothetical protein